MIVPKPRNERNVNRSRLTETQKDRIVTLYNEDWKVCEIAKKTSVSEATVYRILRERRN